MQLLAYRAMYEDGFPNYEFETNEVLESLDLNSLCQLYEVYMKVGKLGKRGERRNSRRSRKRGARAAEAVDCLVRGVLAGSWLEGLQRLHAEHELHLTSEMYAEVIQSTVIDQRRFESAAKIVAFLKSTGVPPIPDMLCEIMVMMCDDALASQWLQRVRRIFGSEVP